FDVLHRAPSEAEVQGWVDAMNRGLSRAQVAQSFTNSTEYRQNVIFNNYFTYLGRAPEPGAVAAWLNAFANGLSEDGSKAKFLSSPEYSNRNGRTSDGWPEQVSRDVLGRPADIGGQTGWLSAIHTGQSLEWTAFQIVVSPEARARIIINAYQGVLGRPPDRSGAAAWLNSMQNGLTPSDLVAQLAGSQEYYQGQGGVELPVAPPPSPPSTPGGTGTTGTGSQPGGGSGQAMGPLTVTLTAPEFTNNTHPPVTVKVTADNPVAGMLQLRIDVDQN